MTRPDTPQPAEPLLTEAEAAQRLKLSVRTMQRHRAAGTGPSHSRLGPRCIRYPATALTAWVERQQVELPS